VVVQPLGEGVPDLVGKSGAVGAPGLAAFAKTIVSQAASADAENAQPGGQDAGDEEFEQRWHKLAPREIARGTENDEQTRELLVSHASNHSARCDANTRLANGDVFSSSMQSEPSFACRTGDYGVLAEQPTGISAGCDSKVNHNLPYSYLSHSHGMILRGADGRFKTRAGQEELRRAEARAAHPAAIRVGLRAEGM
jgi:hypothetical protein